MNIKGLLLGSAAAVVAVSGARAADAVVYAEPEPMEYVRICDTYGAGFYYIPGTETCLKVSGYLRYDIGVGYSGHQDVFDKKDLAESFGESFETNDTYYKRARFALRVDARSETELGTLRAYAQINFNWDSTDSTVITDDGDHYTVDGITDTSTGAYVNFAFIELGGFRAGLTESMFSTFTGYSSGVSNDGLVPYGPFETHQISYTFNGGNGFSAAIALENGNGPDYTIDSYVPHVVGGVAYTAGWGGVSAVVGYDSVWEEFAVKGRVDFNASDAISLFVMAGWDSGDDDFVDSDLPNENGKNFYAQWGGDWAVWVGGAWQINEKSTFNFEVGYDDWENLSVAANIDYEIVPNLHIIPEVVYYDNLGNNPDLEVDDNWGGFLRMQANFGG